MSHDYDPAFCVEDVHQMFELSYASYLVLPRVLLQAMPADWQHRFREVMDEFTETFCDDRVYMVKPRGYRGRFNTDPLAKYRHPKQWVIDEYRRSADG